MDGPLLEIEQGGKRRYLKLTDQPVTIGRHPTNVLVVTDELASRFHCVVERSPGGFSLRDLKSKNGTKLNGDRVESAELRTGDEVRIGETVLRYVMPKPGQTAPSSSGLISPVGQTQLLGASPMSTAPPTASAPKPPARPAPPAQQAPPPPQQPAPQRSGLVQPMPPQRSNPPAQQQDNPPQRPAPAYNSDAHQDDNAPLPMINLMPDQSGPEVKRMGAQLNRPAPTQQQSAFESAPAANAPPPRGAARGLFKPSAKNVPAAPPAAHLRVLREIASSLPDKSVEESEIALLNARNQVVHGAGGDSGDTDPANAEVLRTLRMILVVCFRIRGTDIHFEVKNEDTLVRLRVDGMMVEICRLNQQVALRLNNVIKVLCDIDITGKNAIQEGHFCAKLPNRRVDFRISFTPAVNGQKLVIRVLDMGWAPQHMENLELPNWMFDTIRVVTRQDAGMLLVCGPTGSGKTTTLYSCIRDIDIAQRNVVTIEDPVEYQIEGVTQIPVSSDQGNTFSTVLRSVLRQDPDVILVGEIRDADTAKIAMQASMTGHLVLSTVHAKDTLSTVFRLMDLGIEPYLLASALNIVLSQRLVRVLCPQCKSPVRPTPTQQLKMGRQLEGVGNVFIPEGCKSCLMTGYSGRRAIFEMLHVNEEIRDCILKTPTLQDLRKALRNTVFVSLAETGYKLVMEGVTSFDEIERVVGVEG